MDDTELDDCFVGGSFRGKLRVSAALSACDLVTTLTVSLSCCMISTGAQEIQGATWPRQNPTQRSRIRQLASLSKDSVQTI